jgi:ABC-type hemin transport system ATPase subunit
MLNEVLCLFLQQSSLVFNFYVSVKVLLGKTRSQRKLTRKLTSIEQGLMAGPDCQAGQGKDGTAPSLGEQWLL